MFLTVSSDKRSSGQVSTATVTLSQAAPAGGTPVTLASSHPAATVPASVLVPAGQTQATVSIATQPVAVPTPVTISAAYAGVTKQGQLEVRP
ncbi:MAG: hypothetical protein HY766_09280 [candidate division NC10 bacterium]|nr:hypothetical protein [candidate division NC10 bacterium]